MPTCVSIQSLWENKLKNEEYNVFIIGRDLSKESIEKFQNIKLNGLNLKLLQYKDKYKSLYKNVGYHVSSTALLKFDIPNIFKDKIKILYIDCDTIVNKKGGIQELYNTNIENVYAGVVKDIPMIYQKYYEMLGLTSYFNSGMFLMNLDIMRKEKITEKLIDYKAKNPNGVFVDQDAFNKVFNDKVKYLPYKFNYLTITDKPFYYKSYEYNEKSNPVIIHFATSKKPWKDSTINYADIWYEYYKKSIFKNHKLNRIRKLIYRQKYGNRIIINIFGIKFKYKRFSKSSISYKHKI